jgi:hypothetical protein
MRGVARVKIEKELHGSSFGNSSNLNEFQSYAMAEEKRALRLNAEQFTRLIKITRSTSRYAERDVLVLMLGHHTGSA